MQLLISVKCLSEYYYDLKQKSYKKGTRPKSRRSRLVSFQEHTKPTTVHRAAIPEKDLKTSTRDVPQLKIKGKSPLRWVREAEMVSGQDPQAERTSQL